MDGIDASNIDRWKNSIVSFPEIPNDRKGQRGYGTLHDVGNNQGRKSFVVSFISIHAFIERQQFWRLAEDVEMEHPADEKGCTSWNSKCGAPPWKKEA
jgi:hypothetical protein